MRCDQVLQAYSNILRTVWAIRKELIRVGFFTNVEHQDAPKTAKEIIDLLTTINERGTFIFRRKIRFLDFSGLRLTRLPSYLDDGEVWEQVEMIKMDGNFINSAPDSLIRRCPKIGLPAEIPHVQPTVKKRVEEFKSPPPPENQKWNLLGLLRRKKRN